MKYALTLTIDSEKPGCDPEAISSLGKLARMIDAGNDTEEETPEEDAAEGEIEEEAPSRLGKKAREYAGNGVRKHAMDLFDLNKVDLSNEYDDPKTIGKRTQ